MNDSSCAKISLALTMTKILKIVVTSKMYNPTSLFGKKSSEVMQNS